jgi:hypothetical protein
MKMKVRPRKKIAEKEIGKHYGGSISLIQKNGENCGVSNASIH